MSKPGLHMVFIHVYHSNAWLVDDPKVWDRPCRSWVDSPSPHATQIVFLMSQCVFGSRLRNGEMYATQQRGSQRLAPSFLPFCAFNIVQRKIHQYRIQIVETNIILKP